jgi:signal transduction histidine kinase
VIGCSTGGDHVRVTVGDAGSGIDPAVVERGVSTGRSTGLGLDIARKTAVDAGGTLTIGTTRDGGADVTLTLPALAPHPDGEASA